MVFWVFYGCFGSFDFVSLNPKQARYTIRHSLSESCLCTPRAHPPTPGFLPRRKSTWTKEIAGFFETVTCKLHTIYTALTQTQGIFGGDLPP